MIFWRQVCIVSGTQSKPPVILHIFKNPLLIVRATCRNQKPNWRVAGTLIPTINVPGVGAVDCFFEEINLATQKIEFRHLDNSQYRLKILLPKWLPEIQLTFWEKSEMASYSLEDSIPSNQLATSTKVASVVSVGTTPTKILSANPLRKGLLFVSPDKQKVIYLDTDSVVNATSAIESLSPQRPQCVPSLDWAGEWWGVSPSGAVSISVEEYT